MDYIICPNETIVIFKTEVMKKVLYLLSVGMLFFGLSAVAQKVNVDSLKLVSQISQDQESLKLDDLNKAILDLKSKIAVEQSKLSVYCPTAQINPSIRPILVRANSTEHP